MTASFAGRAPWMSRTADGCFAVDSGTHRIVFWNRSAERVMGISANEAAGAFCEDVICGLTPRGRRFCGKDCPVTCAVKKNQLVRNFNLESRTKLGRKIWLNMSILILDDRKKRFIVHLFRKSPAGGEAGALGWGSGKNGRGRLPAGKTREFSAAEPLTPREIELAELLAQCLSTQKIAERLNISLSTARTHVQHILTKLDAHTKLEAVIRAHQLNLI